MVDRDLVGAFAATVWGMRRRSAARAKAKARAWIETAEIGSTVAKVDRLNGFNEGKGNGKGFGKGKPNGKGFR